MQVMKSTLELEEARRRAPEYISVISNAQCARIRINDIECIEQDGRKLHIVTAEKDYSFYENINTLIESLADRAFYRAMKGLIINLDQIKEIQGNCITFYSGQCVTMGKNSVSKLRQEYRRFLTRFPPYSLWDPSMDKKTPKWKSIRGAAEAGDKGDLTS